MAKDKLFLNQGKISELAIVGQNNIEEQYYNYTIGYFESADQLVKYILNFERMFLFENRLPNGIVDIEYQLHERLNTWIHPICFLYRQYLELTIKDLYFRLTKDTEEEKKQVIKEVYHSLIPLWKKAKILIIENIKDIDKDSLNKIDGYIKQFSDEDPNATKHRFPNSLDGKLNNPKIRKINIKNLSEKMREIENFFATKIFPEFDLIKLLDNIK